MLIAAGLLGLLGACGFGAVGVRQGVIAPRAFDQQIGGLRLVGYHTWNANCPPYVGCDPTRHESYVVWLLVREPEQNYRFIQLPIEHGN